MSDSHSTSISRSYTTGISTSHFVGISSTHTEFGPESETDRVIESTTTSTAAQIDEELRDVLHLCRALFRRAYMLGYTDGLRTSSGADAHKPLTTKSL